MRKDEIVVGGHYLAKVSGNLTTVRVDRIEYTGDGFRVGGHGRKGRKNTTAYHVTNLSTGRKTTFHSAAKFRCVVKSAAQIKEEDDLRAEQDEADRLLEEDLAVRTPDEELSEYEREDVPEEMDPSDIETNLHREAVADRLRLEEREGRQSPDPTPDSSAPIASDTTGRTSCASPVGGSLASRITAARQGRVPGTPVAGMVPNEEQERILAVAEQLGAQITVNENGQIVLVIVAGAGAGKTATCKMLEMTLPGRGQYTAFNKSLVEDSRPKFKKAAVNTTHSLAWRAVGKNYQHRLPRGNSGAARMRSAQVAKILGIQPYHITLNEVREDGTPRTKVLSAEFLAGQCTVAVKKYCSSADRCLGKEHLRYIDGIDSPYTDPDGRQRRGRANNDRVHEYLLPFARAMWEDMTRTDGVLPFSDDCYVKMWQLGEGQDRPIIAADYILLDEYQDTAPVFLDILMQQRHALLVLVGDDNQRIYEWRNAVNAAEYFPDAPRRLLSQSYRFGQTVADVANTVLATLEGPTDLRMKGNPAIPSRVVAEEGGLPEPRCFLYRTNAGAVGRVMMAHGAGLRPHLIGGGDQVIDFCRAALDLQASPVRPTRHPELCCFENWKEVQEYSKTDEGEDLRLMVKLIDQFGAEEILEAIKDMPDEKDADLVVSTAHKSKGREWDTVRLGPDFPLANKMTDSDRRLLYVAATRAQATLDISECPPFCGGYDRKGGEDGSGGADWVPGLVVRYTVPMPTEEGQAAWREGKPVADPTVAHTAVAKPTVTTSAPTTVPVASTNGKEATQFTWCKQGDAWCVRGPKDVAVGTKVTVTRRDGTIKQATIRAVMKKWSDAWVYEV